MATVDADRLLERLAKLHAHFTKHRSLWNNATALCINRGPVDEENAYIKSSILHQYLFGYELPDTVSFLTLDGDFYVLGTKKKIGFLKTAGSAENRPDSLGKFHFLLRNKEDNNAANYETLLDALPVDENKKKIVGLIGKEKEMNKGMVEAFESKLEAAEDVDVVDSSKGFTFFQSIKGEEELDLMKKSSVLSNKLMKHGCVPRLEAIIDKEEKITHEGLSDELDGIIEDPSKINIKIPVDDVSPCYTPIVQSGGEYDIKISSMSNTSRLKFDIITVSLGARYKSYCSNIGRTFLIDSPKKVNERYETLLAMQDACMKALKPGKAMKGVHQAAVNFLMDSGNEDLVPHLPRSLGFSIGMDFRDNNLVLNSKNTVTIRPGMTFALICGFHKLKLTESDKSATSSDSAVKNLSEYALLVSDMIVVKKEGAELLTKMAKALTDISYTINEDDDEEEVSDVDAPDAPVGDEAYARRVARDNGSGGQRQSKRLAAGNAAAQEVHEGAAEREKKQIRLMARRNEERIRELAKANARGRKGGEEDDRPEEIQAYSRTRDYPDGVQPNQVKVDMANQCVILPICGNPVPFHVSTIKNVVLPDPDNATYLRINFYTAGMAVGKDAPINTAKLVSKYSTYASFIREMTFRSLDGQNLTQAFRQIMELRKRARTKELQQQEEANLVEQEKLIRTKNERVPRLSDLTMRPVFSGRKTQGNLEAHTNGLRFISTRSEAVDIMYNNIKYAIFQPCENEIMVLIHFHLKNPIMVGKKRQKDIQFFTEVVDASQAVDNGRRSVYDPDEMDDEQRERQLRKRLNQAFKEFCKKVDMVAKKNDYNVEFDIPYRDLGFMGNPHKEMVFIQPTLNCLVNLTETPFFVVDLADLDHVHFERVTYMSKAFDMVLINKDFSKQPWRIDMIDNGDKDAIQEWLTDMEITYTAGPMNLNWKQIMATVAQDDRFYNSTEEDGGVDKEAGWEFLRMFGRDDDDDDDEDEDDSEFSEAKGGDDDEEEEESEEGENFDSEEDEESDFDADEDLEEQGMDWEDMEREAIAEDRRRGRQGRQEEEVRPSRKRRASREQSSGRAKGRGSRKRR